MNDIASGQTLVAGLQRPRHHFSHHATSLLEVIYGPLSSLRCAWWRGKKACPTPWPLFQRPCRRERQETLKSDKPGLKSQLQHFLRNLGYSSLSLFPDMCKWGETPRTTRATMKVRWNSMWKCWPLETFPPSTSLDASPWPHRAAHKDIGSPALLR